MPGSPPRPTSRRRPRGWAIGLVVAVAAASTMMAAPRSEAAPATKVPRRSSVWTAPASTSTLPSCGGVTISRPGGGSWQCTFEDDFNGRALDSNKWTVQETASSGFHSGPECFVNRKNNISLASGTLRLTVRKESQPFTCSSPLGDYTTQYTSGMVSTWGKFSQAYGRFEVRAKLPAATVQGLQESFWLYPPDLAYGAWPRSGEIDIAEVYSSYPDRAIPFIHYDGEDHDPNVTNNYCFIADISQFHTYAVEWTPTSITVIYDGTTCLVNDSWSPNSPLVNPQPFDQPFILILTQALGIATNAFDPARTPLPATTLVDYARIWK